MYSTLYNGNDKKITSYDTVTITCYETTVDEIWRIVIFIFKLFDSLMDSPPNYEEMLTETQLIILFSLLLVISVHHSLQ